MQRTQITRLKARLDALEGIKGKNGYSAETIEQIRWVLESLKAPTMPQQVTEDVRERGDPWELSDEARTLLDATARGE